MAKKRTPNKAELFLGERIKKFRIAREMTHLQLGKKINKIEQQVAKYENGEFVPLGVLEDIANVLADQIPKKIIRRISTLRKKEMDTKIEQTELIDLYMQALPEDELYLDE